jgi:hypothetical protein
MTSARERRASSRRDERTDRRRDLLPIIGESRTLGREEVSSMAKGKSMQKEKNKPKQKKKTT